MRDTDLPGFMAVVKRLVVLQRMEDSDRQQVASSYFRALQRFDLADLERAADRWLETQTRFPKPVQLADLAFQLRRPAVEPPPEIPEHEARTWLKAERQHWEGERCGCQECVAHGVADVPRRFVPILDESDRDVRARVGDRVVTRGEWIHGVALMRWHIAKEQFYTKARGTQYAGLVKP